MNLSATKTPRKPVPTPLEARTTAALLTTIAAALDGDGSYIAPGSIDSQGLTVVAGIWRWRLELSEPEVMDWLEHTPDSDDASDARRVCDRIDREWMAETDMPF